MNWLSLIVEAALTILPDVVRAADAAAQRKHERQLAEDQRAYEREREDERRAYMARQRAERLADEADAEAAAAAARAADASPVEGTEPGAE